MPLHVDEQLCKGCELCVFHCPKDVLWMTKKMNRKGFNVVGIGFPEKCTNCKLCEINCPDLAIFIE